MGGYLGRDHSQNGLTVRQGRLDLQPTLETPLVAENGSGLRRGVTAAVIKGIGYMAAWVAATLHLEIFRVVGLLAGDIPEQIVD
jgi:hypothetical protein